MGSHVGHGHHHVPVAGQELEEGIVVEGARIVARKVEDQGKGSVGGRSARPGKSRLREHRVHAGQDTRSVLLRNAPFHGQDPLEAGQSGIQGLLVGTPEVRLGGRGVVVGPQPERFTTSRIRRGIPDGDLDGPGDLILDGLTEVVEFLLEGPTVVVLVLDHVADGVRPGLQPGPDLLGRKGRRSCRGTLQQGQE